MEDMRLPTIPLSLVLVSSMVCSAHAERVVRTKVTVMGHSQPMSLHVPSPPMRAAADEAAMKELAATAKRLQESTEGSLKPEIDIVRVKQGEGTHHGAFDKTRHTFATTKVTANITLRIPE
jgi:hypothetical protein